jgi:hypothetical protein
MLLAFTTAKLGVKYNFANGLYIGLFGGVPYLPWRHRVKKPDPPSHNNMLTMGFSKFGNEPNAA